MKRAIVSGGLGQSGSYMAKLLLSKGYEEVIVLHRLDTHPCNKGYGSSFICYDLNLQEQIQNIINNHRVDEFYHFAGQSSVSLSWEDSGETLNTNTIVVSKILEAIKQHSPKTKFFLASTSEVYQPNKDVKFNEDSPTNPQSPYAISKLSAEQLVKIYREKYGIYACYARLFPHTSPRQKESFVAKKIAKEVVRFSKGEAFPFFQPIQLGNIDIFRDCFHAKDAVEGIYRMMQLFEPTDFVLGSGNVYSIRSFIDKCFLQLRISDWENYVTIDKTLYEKNNGSTCADIRKAEKFLQWHPKIKFDDIVKEMIDYELSNYNE